jgi:paraquat-inducible protein B
MKGKFSAFWVGLFVLTGLVLGVAATLVFGGGRLFRETVPFVMFFEGAVSGLQEGAPVTFRGVKVGTVTGIAVAISGDGQVRIPVYIELYPASVRGHRGRSLADTYAQMDELVGDGLRAQLQLQSLLTGMLVVRLDFFPEEPPRLVGGDLSVPELPTKQSGLQRLTESMQQIKVDEIAQRMLNALEGIDRIVNSRQTQEGVADTAAMLRDLREIVAEIKARVGPLSEELDQTGTALRVLIEQLNQRVGPLLAGVEAATAETQRLAANVNTAVERLAPKVEQGVETATRVLEHAGQQLDLENGPAAALVANLTRTSAAADRAIQQTMATLEAAAGPESPLQTEVAAMVAELRDAARSLRVLTDYLQRHPAALVRGKAGVKEDE